MMPGRSRRFIFNIIGFCLIVLGLANVLFSEIFFNQFLEREMILSPESKTFELWKKPPLKIKLDFYLFNWTNPEDFDNPDIKPKLEELGPYRFTEVPHKVDIKWHPQNASMTYKKQSKYYFDAEGSKGRLEDEIVTVNSLAVSLSFKAKNWNLLRRKVIDMALNVYNDDISVKKTVNELLFEGYDDVLLNLANFLPSSLTEVKVPFDKFGYCYPRNYSADVTGVFNIHTGADDIRKFGQVHTWNYHANTNAYAAECAKVYGSPGEFQSLYLQPHKPVNFFLSDLCRSIKLDYVEATEVEGIPGYRYEGGKRMVDNGTLYPENVCHCNGQCVPSGLMNITSCWFGSPMFLSYPHFHDADPSYLSAVDGLKPDKEKHELYLVLEPKSGLLIDLAGRLQSNILIEPIEHFKLFKNKRRIFFPLFWFEARTRVPLDLVGELKLLPRVILSAQILGVFSILAGLILLAWYPIKVHLQNRLIQQIKINNLDSQTHHEIVGKKISLQPEISPLLVDSVKANAKMLERADTEISNLSIDACASSTDRSSMQSTTSST